MFIFVMFYVSLARFCQKETWKKAWQRTGAKNNPEQVPREAVASAFWEILNTQLNKTLSNLITAYNSLLGELFYESVSLRNRL